MNWYNPRVQLFSSVHLKLNCNLPLHLWLILTPSFFSDRLSSHCYDGVSGHSPVAINSPFILLVLLLYRMNMFSLKKIEQILTLCLPRNWAYIFLWLSLEMTSGGWVIEAPLLYPRMLAWMKVFNNNLNKNFSLPCMVNCLILRILWTLPLYTYFLILSECIQAQKIATLESCYDRWLTIGIKLWMIRSTVWA